MRSKPDATPRPCHPSTDCDGQVGVRGGGLVTDEPGDAHDVDGTLLGQRHQRFGWWWSTSEK
jgi:hypothetical protein